MNSEHEVGWLLRGVVSCMRLCKRTVRDPHGGGVAVDGLAEGARVVHELQRGELAFR